LTLSELKENSIYLYPNPFTDFAEMKLDTENLTDISIRIIDMLGNELINEKLIDGRISRGNLNSGMYVLQVFNTNGILGVSNIIVQD
jgi:hypothetical protein